MPGSFGSNKASAQRPVEPSLPEPNCIYFPRRQTAHWGPHSTRWPRTPQVGRPVLTNSIFGIKYMHNRALHANIHPLQLALFRTSPDPQPSCQELGSKCHNLLNPTLRATPAQPHRAGCRSACPTQPALSQAGGCMLSLGTHRQGDKPQQ